MLRAMDKPAALNLLFNPFPLIEVKTAAGIDWNALGNQALDFAKANPEVAGALAGGTVGGISGLVPDEDGDTNITRNALIGAGVGGLSGFGYRKYDDHLKNLAAEQAKKEKADAVRAQARENLKNRTPREKKWLWTEHQDEVAKATMREEFSAKRKEERQALAALDAILADPKQLELARRQDREDILEELQFTADEYPHKLTEDRVEGLKRLGIRSSKDVTPEQMAAINRQLDAERAAAEEAQAFQKELDTIRAKPEARNRRGQAASQRIPSTLNALQGLK